MKIFAIADLHLSLDQNIDKPMSAFGEGWENYEERLRTAWLETVTDNDTVIIPGDISWGLKLAEAEDDLAWIHELPGMKILFKGNHDLWWNRITYLNSLYDDMRFVQSGCHYIESIDTAIAGTRGWVLPGSEEYTEHDEKIYRRELMRLRVSLEGTKRTGARRVIAALHYPPAEDMRRDTEFTGLLEEYGVETCVYGHLHGAAAFGKGIKGNHNGVEYMLVSLDYLGAKPKLVLDCDAR